MTKMPSGPFTIKDAKRVFPGLADGVVQKWRDKGFIIGNAVKRGLSVEIQYDIYQLVHINVVNELSILGVFQRHLSNLSVYVEPLFDDFSLTDPGDIEQILNTYAMLDAQAILTIEILEIPLKDANYRNRRAEVQYFMRLGVRPDEQVVNIGTLIPGTELLSFTTAEIRIGMMLTRCRQLLGK
ncbi:MAG: hypothetical protein ACLQO6_12685 [Desulfomonilaceae bacterium]